VIAAAADTGGSNVAKPTSMGLCCNSTPDVRQIRIKLGIRPRQPNDAEVSPMDSEPAVIASLRKAVAALPDDLGLRLHLASMLLTAGLAEEGISHLGAVLQADPANVQALRTLAEVGRAQLTGPEPTSAEAIPALAPEQTRPPDTAKPSEQAPPPEERADTPSAVAASADTPSASAPSAGAPSPGTPSAGAPSAGALSADAPSADAPSAGAPSASQPTAASQAADRQAADDGPADSPLRGAEAGGFNWVQAEAELQDVLPPMFVTQDGSAADEYERESPAHDAEKPGLHLADVAGLAEVKARLEAAFLAPMRNPELRRLYGKSLRGGLLLYGPPGCGKTFIARAVAGELGARFLAVSFADVVDMYIGSSERNIREMFAIARRNAPCVLFLDEVDAIGQKRSQLRNTPMRSAVNQLLLELDDVTGGNDGVFVLAATNHPWDVDSALRRPGRFDRTLLVLPPDPQAREAVFRFHLKDRPVAGINLAKLAAMTEGYSAADIAHVCESAAELALLDSARSGQVRMIRQDDLAAATAQVRPSLAPWFESARNVALFANEGGAYDDLAAYLKKRKML
jgi:AAA+ superfamily predicted ATPase